MEGHLVDPTGLSDLARFHIIYDFRVFISKYNDKHLVTNYLGSSSREDTRGTGNLIRLQPEYPGADYTAVGDTRST